MLNRLDIWTIIKHECMPITYEHCPGSDSVHKLNRHFNFLLFMFFIVIPMAVGVFLAFYIAPLDSKILPITLAVSSIVAAVMTGFLPLAHTVAGMTDINEKFDPGEYLIVRDKLNKLATLRDLYSNVAFAVVLAVFSIAPQLLLLITALPNWYRCAISGVLFGFGLVLAMSFLKIISGVYLVLDIQAEDFTQTIKNNAVIKTEDVVPIEKEEETDMTSNPVNTH